MKANRVRRFLVILVLLALVVPSAVFADSDASPRFIYALIDLSGSYVKYRPTAFNYIRKLIFSLRPGDTFVLRSISSESFSDRNSILVITLPRASGRIDPSFQRRIAAMKNEVVARLDAVRSARSSGFTDLCSSLATASESLKVAEGKKHLVIFSDLDDNRGKKRGGGATLENVVVSVRFLPRGADPDAFEKRLNRWRVVFTESGAHSISFFDMDGMLMSRETKGGEN